MTAKKSSRKALSLSVAERVKLLSALPREGDITTLRVVRDLQNELSFSEEELAEYEIKRSGGNITWKGDKDRGKEIKIGEAGLKIISDALKKLSEAEKLTVEYVPLYERFVKD